MEADTTGDFEEICNQLRLYQAALRTCFTLENFDNLIKNGRMRPLVGTLLHSLGIHVIADATPQGTIHVGGQSPWRSQDLPGHHRADGHQQGLHRRPCDRGPLARTCGAMKLKPQILEDRR